MSAKQTENTNTLRTALVVDEKTQSTVWDLAAETVAYPLDVDGPDGKPYRLGVYLSRYDARELKDALNAERQGYSPDGDGDFATLQRTYREFFPMLERHIVRLDGVTSDDPARHQAFVRGNTQLKTLIVKETWGGVRLWRPPDEPTSELFDIDSVGDAPTEVATTQRLWSSDLTVTAIRMTHFMRRPTQNQYNRHASAIRQKVGRRGLLSADINYDTLELLYNEGIVRIDGMTVDGRPCMEANRNEFVSLVPLWHKTLVVGELYREARVKN
jgi:hypothetical protein